MSSLPDPTPVFTTLLDQATRDSDLASRETLRLVLEDICTLYRSNITTETPPLALTDNEAGLLELFLFAGESLRASLNRPVRP